MEVVSLTKKRIHYFDNGRFILIFLVVFGHFLRSYIHDGELLYALYITIYFFHMPAFIMISGFFARSSYKKDYFLKLLKKLILPYIIFQFIYTVYYFFLFDEQSFSLNFFVPQWSLWFLLSLFCWHGMLPVFAKFKPAVGLSLSFIIGILIGYIDFIDSFLSLSRTFVFFPFFLIGYYLKKEHLQLLKHRGIQLLSLVTFTVIFIFFYIYPELNFEWLFGSKPYFRIATDLSTAWFIRLSIYVLSVVTVLAFWSLVPKKQYSFTKIGRYTLYIYLLHGFFIRAFRSSGIEEWISEHQLYLLLIPVALLLTYILSSKWIRMITQPVIELNISNWKALFMRLNQRLFS